MKMEDISMIKVKGNLTTALALSAGLLALSLLPSKANADISLNEVLDACEASVVQSTDAPLLRFGEVIDENERQQRIRLNTSVGTLVATIFPPLFNNVLGCILWGGHPDLKAEFANEWQDWVEWEEAEGAAKRWQEDRLKVPGSVDLTDNQQPGFVVARCDVLENGIVLANQPAVTGVIRQTTPNLDPPPSPNIFFQFSVMRALPGRCQAAVDARSDQ
ncbi:hypothetical protein ACFSDD_23840 [Salipiger marinus]|uniref:hypothetical protein n=1 Tax=Salipiger marinus TaxID=555512 RepID=UPI002CCF554B|nr:hypothetical protein [Salipiger manganoxidans]MEB3422097.1 hypothetical protein [Salipiger manganoxidans]